MAKVVLRNCFISVNGTDISDHISAVTVNLSKDEVETTNFGGLGRERVAGLKDDSFECTVQQDYDSGNTDAILYPLWNNETEFTVEVRPTNAVVGVNNPKYTATCILLEYSPLDGKVGDLSDTKITFPAQRSGIARATS